MKEYFKDVPRDIMEELKSLFKIDFEMFGYSYDDIWFSLKNSNIWNMISVWPSLPVTLIMTRRQGREILKIESN